MARAIQHGETETGVTVIRMTPRIDAGGILSIARTPIDPDETAGALEDRLAQLGAPLLVATIADLVAGTAQVLPQEKSKVTKAPKLTKDDGRIDWTKPARVIHNLVRAMQPWPTARTAWHPAESVQEPVPLIVHQTAVADGSGPAGTVLEADGDRILVAAAAGAVRLLLVQIPGKKVSPAAEFLRGYRVRPGDRLG